MTTVSSAWSGPSVAIDSADGARCHRLAPEAVAAARQREKSSRADGLIRRPGNDSEALRVPITRVR
jgi:hypothetical protein